MNLSQYLSTTLAQYGKKKKKIYICLEVKMVYNDELYNHLTQKTEFSK